MVQLVFLPSCLTTINYIFSNGTGGVPMKNAFSFQIYNVVWIFPSIRTVFVTAATSMEYD